MPDFVYLGREWTKVDKPFNILLERLWENYKAQYHRSTYELHMYRASRGDDFEYLVLYREGTLNTAWIVEGRIHFRSATYEWKDRGYCNLEVSARGPTKEVALAHLEESVTQVLQCSPSHKDLAELVPK